MSQEPAARRNPRWPAIGIALFVIGLLIVVPSGLCTALGLAVVLSPGMGDISMLGLVLTFGGVPMALGAVLVYAGWKSRRRD
jgi:hypothetical protein